MLLKCIYFQIHFLIIVIFIEIQKTFCIILYYLSQIIPSAYYFQV